MPSRWFLGRASWEGEETVDRGKEPFIASRWRVLPMLRDPVGTFNVCLCVFPPMRTGERENRPIWLCPTPWKPQSSQRSVSLPVPTSGCKGPEASPHTLCLDRLVPGPRAYTTLHRQHSFRHTHTHPRSLCFSYRLQPPSGHCRLQIKFFTRGVLLPCLGIVEISPCIWEEESELMPSIQMPPYISP